MTDTRKAMEQQGEWSAAASSLQHEWTYYYETEGLNGDSLNRAIERAVALLAAAPAAQPDDAARWMAKYSDLQRDTAITIRDLEEEIERLKAAPQAQQEVTWAGDPSVQDYASTQPAPQAQQEQVGILMKHSERDALSPDAQKKLAEMIELRRKQDAVARSNFPSAPLLAAPAPHPNTHTVVQQMVKALEDRVVKCHAACEGIPTYQLTAEDGKPTDLAGIIDALRAEHDGFRKVAEQMVGALVRIKNLSFCADTYAQESAEFQMHDAIQAGQQWLKENK